MYSVLLLLLDFEYHLQLDPSTVWLKEEYGSKAFFPSANNLFVFPPDVVNSLSYIEGTPVNVLSSTTTGSQLGTGSRFTCPIVGNLDVMLR